jgi:hypothetical protein
MLQELPWVAECAAFMALLQGQPASEMPDHVGADLRDAFHGLVNDGQECPSYVWFR